MRKTAKKTTAGTHTPTPSTVCPGTKATLTDKGGPAQPPANPATPIDPTSLHRGDQFTATLFGNTQATCIYQGSFKGGYGTMHDFLPLIPGNPPTPFGSLTLMEGRDIGKDLPTPFGMTRITKDHPQWINQPDTSLGNMLDALGELQAMEQEHGEQAAFNPATMMSVFLKHTPKEHGKQLKDMLGQRPSIMLRPGGR